MNRAAAVFAIVCILQAVVFAACSEEGTAVYQARLYDRARDCLGPGTSIDVVTGREPTRICPVVCLVQKQGDGGRIVYTSTQCAPYPVEFDVSGAEPICAAAIAAHTRNDTCLSDGGSSAPLPRDAGSDG